MLECGLCMFRVAYMLYAEDSCCSCCDGKKKESVRTCVRVLKRGVMFQIWIVYVLRSMYDMCS